jgi:hypothetical protein
LRGAARVAAALGVLVLLAPGAAGAVVGDGTTFGNAVASWTMPAAGPPPAPPPTPFNTVAVGPVSLASDRAGNEYAVYSDGHHVWESFSRDRGATWSTQARVDIGPGTAILPVAIAGEAGRVAVAYYKTPYENGDAPAWGFPVDAVWWVALAEDTATLERHVFAENRATSAVHYGGAPTLPLGLALWRQTGFAAVTYPSDQFDPQEPAPPQCTAAAANTAACLHLMRAVQTSGPRLVSPRAVHGVKAARKTLHRRP